LKQVTSIFNNVSLKNDHEKRKADYELLEERIVQMQEYHAKLNRILQRANQIQMAQMTN